MSSRVREGGLCAFPAVGFNRRTRRRIQERRSFRIAEIRAVHHVPSGIQESVRAATATRAVRVPSVVFRITERDRVPSAFELTISRKGATGQAENAARVRMGRPKDSTTGHPGCYAVFALPHAARRSLEVSLPIQEVAPRCQSNQEDQENRPELGTEHLNA